MQKRVGIFVLLALTTATVAFAAPDRTGRWDAGVNLAAAIPSDSDTDTALQVGGNLAYGVNEWFAVGFSGGWQQHDVDGTTSGAIVVSGTEVTGVPLFLDLIARVPTGAETFQPYGVLGLGAVLWDIDDATARSGATTLAVETDVDTEFSTKVGGGVDWFLNERWIINAEAAYVFSSPEARVTVLGTSVTDDIDLDYWTVGGGIKYLF
jgi:outer membrane protein W